MIAQHSTESVKRAVKPNMRGHDARELAREGARVAARRAEAVGVSLHDDGAEPAVSALVRVAVLGYN